MCSKMICQEKALSDYAKRTTDFKPVSLSIESVAGRSRRRTRKPVSSSSMTTESTCWFHLVSVHVRAETADAKHRRQLVPTSGSLLSFPSRIPSIHWHPSPTRARTASALKQLTPSGTVCSGLSLSWTPSSENRTPNATQFLNKFLSFYLVRK